MKAFLPDLRKANTTDIPFLLKLRMETMEVHLQSEGIFLSEEEHLQRIEYQFEHAKLILIEGQKIGMLKTLEHKDHIELVQLQLVHAFQGKGIGQNLIKSLMKEADRRQRFVSLSVLKKNKARRLYKRLGFRIVKETEDSVIMRT